MFSTNVTKRRCSYKNCDSMQGGGEKTCSVTFFQFPRDEDRYNLWMQLGRCDINDKKGAKYFCSKHFDERKYVASNPRRKLLLATAIPYEYMSDDEEQIIEQKIDQLENVGSTEEEYFTIHEINMDVRKDDTGDGQIDPNRFVESTINDEEEQSILTLEDSDYVREEESFVVKSDNVYSAKKRKITTDEWSPTEIIKSSTYKSPTSSGKIAKPTTSQQVTSDSVMEKEHSEDSDEENFTGHPYITSFIFRGEEYVQMPKDAYVRANKKLVKELNYYKSIVKKCKKQFENIKMLD